MSGKSRLAEALVDWMKQAEERGVYLEYRFSGPRPAPCCVKRTESCWERLEAW